MKQIFGIFDFKTGCYSDASKGILSFKNGNISAFVMGRIYCNGILNDKDSLLRIFADNNNTFTEYVSGIYIAVFYDSEKKTVSVFHDRSTSSNVMYYTVCNDKLYIGTSLKRILLESGLKRSINNDVIEDFITNGYLYGDETLINNIYKIKAFHALTADESGVTQISVEYPVKEMTKGQALDSFRSTLDNAVEKCFSSEDEINLPLSSGFDSNYIAHVASTVGRAPVNAFSVGGKFGKNELPVVEKNVEYYDRMTLNSALTDDDTLQNFPDIVWRLEGSVYEVGLFLQYELAKLVNGKCKKYLICGECADQVMNMYYLQQDRVFPEKKDGKSIHYEFSEYPFIFGNYLILKKNGILANSFGIETRYPYLDEDVVAVSHALRNVNGKDKRVHTANCSECLPPDVLANMSKIGGSTDCHSLFNSKDDIERFFSKIEKSEFYRKHSDIIKSHSFSEKEKQTGSAKLKTSARNAALDILGIGKKGREDNAYFHEEIKLREYLCVAYLILFEKLFIDSKENDFSKDGISIKFSDIL